uniref:translation initiation factor 2 n=1 Tax=Caulacanthus ustulatus TaxID=31411 RepID=UPI0027DA3FDB|nr:translation initiation factor 2 [Caulacanthus ustulatus]WCH57327.1 translation initiation factor 2 [Caulacanthus ustulatus]
MINKILFISPYLDLNFNNKNLHICALESKKDIMLLDDPQMVYLTNSGNTININSSQKVVQNMILTDIHETKQKTSVSFSSKLEKKSKGSSKIENSDYKNDIRKNKIKLRKKTRSQINLNNDDLFLDNKNFISSNVSQEHNIDISLDKNSKVNKKKYKYKFQKNLLDIDSNQVVSSKLYQDTQLVDKNIILNKPLSIKDLSKKLHITEASIITWLFLQGISVNINQVVDTSIAIEVAKNYGFTVIYEDQNNTENFSKDIINDTELNLSQAFSRAPIITVFGHVDHGKTTLLDSIRKTNLVTSEVGGITQSIKGYKVEFDYLSSKEKLVFLDTPGHEAFSHMRLRGAEVTDLALLVVSADDGLKQQTIEAINHILSRKIPYVVAINKIDKANINLKKVKQQLGEYNILDKKWGGNNDIIEVSALMSTNIDKLLNALCNLSQTLNLQANYDSLAKGTILESHIDKKTGSVANLLVQNGTLQKGNIIVVGNIYGKVKSLTDSCGDKISEARPSDVINMWGFSSTPQAGLKFKVVQTEKLAKTLVSQNMDDTISSNCSNLLNTRVTLDSYKRQSKLKIINIILKANTQGSLEAIISSFADIPQEKVQLNILAVDSGSISNKDVELAAASQSIILGFNINLDARTQYLADKLNIKINVFKIIYSLLDFVKYYMLNLVDLEYDKSLIGQATVQTVFSMNKGTVAGCRVDSGKLKRKLNMNIYRNQNLLYSGIIDSLKRLKNDVEEVSIGNECGVMCIDFHGWQRLDIIKVYELVEKVKTL